MGIYFFSFLELHLSVDKFVKSGFFSFLFFSFLFFFSFSNNGGSRLSELLSEFL